MLRPKPITSARRRQHRPRNFPVPLYVAFSSPSRRCRRQEPGDRSPVFFRTPETNRARHDCVSCNISSLTSSRLANRSFPPGELHQTFTARHHVEGGVLLASHSLGSVVVMLQQCGHAKRFKTGLVRISSAWFLTKSHRSQSVISTCV